jgi:hypothetical protein
VASRGARHHNNKAWVWAVVTTKTNLLDTGALALVGEHCVQAACGGGKHHIIPHIRQKPVAGVSVAATHTSGKSLWRG